MKQLRDSRLGAEARGDSAKDRLKSEHLDCGVGGVKLLKDSFFYIRESH